ncbi:hypothetical protein [Streptomyces sp. NPDC046942]|uniref:hypothetical protein n=1 Tax=Streptomyces sp. NPDC046942 TaxID=3155137 RepID=UPI0033DA1CB3
MEEVATLKHTVNGEIRVYASSRLVHTLIEHELVDELRLACGFWGGWGSDRGPRRFGRERRGPGGGAGVS